MVSTDSLWLTLKNQAALQQKREPLLYSFYQQLISKHDGLTASISYLLADKLQSQALPQEILRPLFLDIFSQSSEALRALQEDLNAVAQRDSACEDICHAYCFYKGFHALCAYRAMHQLWQQNKMMLALQLQQRSAIVCDVDIHPAAKIGYGIMLDHATGIVVGETAVIGNHVSIMQGVTLGGTGKESGDRHPKISNDVLISVGATVLGNITIGTGAQIAAGSVVLKAVPAHTIAAGVPAKIIGRTSVEHPALEMNHTI